VETRKELDRPVALSYLGECLGEALPGGVDHEGDGSSQGTVRPATKHIGDALDLLARQIRGRAGDIDDLGEAGNIGRNERLGIFGYFFGRHMAARHDNNQPFNT
jgi:hypothetical protein